MGYNPVVLTSRDVAMQRLLDAVNNGYSEYATGEVSMERAQAVFQKFAIQYQVDADRNVRVRRKRNGLGNATLILLRMDGKILWWLLVTPADRGEHLAHTFEKLRSALDRKSRLIFDGYELVRLPKPSKFKPLNNNAKSSQARLTWRISREAERSLRYAIIDAVRQDTPYRLDLLIYRIWACPGFGGVRSQIGKLAALYRAEVRRANRLDAPAPPKRLVYLRRLKSGGMRLSEIVAANRRQAQQR